MRRWKRPALANKAVALRWWPVRCARWPSAARQAAKEIKNLIGESVGKVENGSRLVGDAGKTMDDIVSHVKRVTDLIAGISSEQPHPSPPAPAPAGALMQGSPRYSIGSGPTDAGVRS